MTTPRPIHRARVAHPDGVTRAAAYAESLRGKTAFEVIDWAVAEFGQTRVALASSLGAEDQVLTEMLCRAADSPQVFTLDTGRLFQQTYDLMQVTRQTYGLDYDVFAPDPAELAELLRQDGPNGMYESVAQRKACCEVRKVRPLRRALAGLDAWLCGLRRAQGPTRGDIEVVSWDIEHDRYKVCPLHDWSEDAVWQYIRAHQVPHSVLHSRGFRSIGCEPCTRAIAPADPVRAGRWWWEQPEHRECGLHPRGSGAATAPADNHLTWPPTRT